MTDFSLLYSSLLAKRDRLFKKQKKYESILQQNKTAIAVIDGHIVELTKNGCIVDNKEHLGEYFIGDNVLVQIKHPHYVQVLPSKYNIILYEAPICCHFDNIGCIYTNEAGIHTLNWREKDEKFCLFTPHLFHQCLELKSSINHVLVRYTDYVVIYTRDTMVSIKAIHVEMDWISIFDISRLRFGLLYIKDKYCKFDVCNNSTETVTEYELPFVPKKCKLTKYGVLLITNFKLVHLDMMNAPRIQFELECNENDMPLIDADIYKHKIYLQTEESVVEHNLED